MNHPTEQDVIAAGKLMLEQLAKARSDEREKCCADVCRVCAEGQVPIRSVKIAGLWRHQPKIKRDLVVTCRASPIRERIHQETLRRSQPPNAIQDNRIANNTEHNQ